MQRFTHKTCVVAGVVAMLASADGGYVTGAEVTIDGGLLAGSAAAPG